MTKKITFNELMDKGGIARLEKNGVNREVIHKEMYRHTAGASTQERENIMRNLYDRERK